MGAGQRTAAPAPRAAAGAPATPAADAALARARATLAERVLAAPDGAALLMVSGGSDSTALAYLAHRLREEGDLGAVAMLHVNHQLRGADADDDARFVSQLAELLEFPLFLCEVDVAGEAARTGGNVEAVARHERYLAANEALRSMCLHEAVPLAAGRILTAHTADDRIESFYMRSIVGTGPGGFRAMRYRNGPVVRPLLDLTRDDLRALIAERADAGLPVARDEAGALWREDATNAHTDRFRAYVRHEVVPRAREWNPALPEVLTRTMNLIADEDDMLDGMADDLVARAVAWLGAEDARDGAEGAEGTTGGAAGAPGDVPGTHAPAGAPGAGAADPTDAPGAPGPVSGDAPASGAAATPGDADPAAGFLLEPAFAEAPVPLRRRAVRTLLGRVLGPDARVEAASVEAVLAGFAPAADPAPGAPAAPDRPRGGYVANIQGDLAVSANRHGVRVEPMAAFRARRKKN